MKDKERINISIIPRAHCLACKGLGMVRGDMVPYPFGFGIMHKPDTFCDCVIEQMPNDENDYDITLKFEDRKTQHTPEPWRIQLDDDDEPTEAYIRAVTADDELIAIVYSHHDALLILRAPKMLALLQRILPIIQAEADQRDTFGQVFSTEKTAPYWSEMREIETEIAREIWEALGRPDAMPAPDYDDDDHAPAILVQPLPDEDPDDNNMLAAELRNIANAKRANFEDAESFRDWAQSRARHALSEYAKQYKHDDYDYAADDRNFDADRERRMK